MKNNAYFLEAMALVQALLKDNDSRLFASTEEMGQKSNTSFSYNKETVVELWYLCNLKEVDVYAYHCSNWRKGKTSVAFVIDDAVYTVGLAAATRCLEIAVYVNGDGGGKELFDGIKSLSDKILLEDT